MGIEYICFCLVRIHKNLCATYVIYQLFFVQQIGMHNKRGAWLSANTTVLCLTANGPVPFSFSKETIPSHTKKEEKMGLSLSSVAKGTALHFPNKGTDITTQQKELTSVSQKTEACPSYSNFLRAFLDQKGTDVRLMELSILQKL
jgi:hypothetical protein